MRIVRLELYKFNELLPEVQQKLLSNFLEAAYKASSSVIKEVRSRVSKEVHEKYGLRGASVYIRSNTVCATVSDCNILSHKAIRDMFNVSEVIKFVLHDASEKALGIRFSPATRYKMSKESVVYIASTMDNAIAQYYSTLGELRAVREIIINEAIRIGSLIFDDVQQIAERVANEVFTKAVNDFKEREFYISPLDNEVHLALYMLVGDSV